MRGLSSFPNTRESHRKAVYIPMVIELLLTLARGDGTPLPMACAMCPRGRHISSDGIISCPRGRHISSDGIISCPWSRHTSSEGIISCPRGRHTSSAGILSCPRGRHTSSAGIISCQWGRNTSSDGVHNVPQGSRIQSRIPNCTQNQEKKPLFSQMLVKLKHESPGVSSRMSWDPTQERTA